MMLPKWLGYDVSRETYQRLECYVELVKKWNPRINLVSKASLEDIWSRHIWDSLQIVDVHPVFDHWVDIGSGGGLPAIVLAIVSAQSNPTAHVQMIESDQRKCAFLRNAIRELDLKATVTTSRIEALPKLNANTISARALTDLNGLLGFAEQHLGADGVTIFPKGATWQQELKQAQENWSFEYEAHKSHTNPSAVILKINEIARV